MSSVIDTYELSTMQAGMLGHSLREPSSGIDIEHLVMELPGGFNLKLFDAAWQRAMARHDVLRTVFSLDAAYGFVQQVLAAATIGPAIEDWSTLNSRDFAARLAQRLEEESRRGFDLTAGLPWRLVVLHGPDAAHTVLWTFHHAILDARSFTIILREVFADYDALLMGQTLTERLACRPYRDYIAWLRSLDLAAAEGHWRKLLAGYRTPTRLWIERSRSPDDSTTSTQPCPAFGHVETLLSTEVTTLLATRAQRDGGSLNTAIQAAWAVLLSRLSSEADVVFGATRACRHSIDGSRDMVGLFINTLPVRVQIDDDAKVGGLLRGLRDQALEVRPFEHTPLNKVQGWSDLPRGSPLFESIVVFDTATLDARLRTDEPQWAGRQFRYRGQTNYPLALIAYGGERLLLRLEYSLSRFDPADAERLLRYLATLLSHVAQSRDTCRVRDLTVLPDNERSQLISVTPPRQFTSPAATLHEWFETRVRERPDAAAATCDQHSLTYAELNARANRLAHELRRRGLRRGELVGLAAERTLDIPIGVLAILKAGGAYLPLDPSYPRDRVAFMLDDAQVRFVLADPTVAAKLSIQGAAMVQFDGAEFADQPTTNPQPLATGEDVAYVIYTSGSTGKPKGVQVTHANVCRLFSATDAWFAFGPHDVWTLFHSYAFDFSVWEIWGALLYGGRLVVVPYWISRDPAAFRKLLLDERVTVLNQTPSAFRQLIQADQEEAPADYALRTVIFGGEALELHTLKPWFERYGDERPRLVNMYGITETTVHVTYRPITQADIAAGLGSVIGEPIPDLYLRLLDPRGEPTPVGVPGEIWVGGAGVALGYLNRPELTAERFVIDPFDPAGQSRLYRSGDLARRLANGDLEFLGRIDDQVKIRGFRIELGEIEAVLAARSEVADAAVVMREDTPGDKRLVAYVVPRQADLLSVESLRHAANERLPAHMVPAHFVRLDAVPLNANGKLDRAALPAPPCQESAAGRASRAIVAPRSETETVIAQVWADVLKLEQISVTDHFFELGGDSILGIQVVARCRRAGFVISARDLFEHPTVAELARRAIRADSAESKAATTALGRDVKLTPIQRWFFEHNFVVKNYWNQAFLFQVPAELDVSRLERCLEAVVARHDAFRVRFRRDGTRPEESTWLGDLAAASDPIAIRRHNLSTEPPEVWPGRIQELCTRGQATLDIERGPLVHAAHFQLGPGVPGRLLLAVHHLAIDGVSWRILLEDLEAAYDCLSRGAAISLPPSTTSFQQWADRIDHHARHECVTDSLATWQAIVAAPADSLPLPATDGLERDAATVTVELTAEETAALLQEVPAAYRTQINDVLLAALVQALQQSSGGTRFLIEMEGHGREEIAHDLDISRTVGWFTSLFPVRLDLARGTETGPAIQSIKEQLRQIPHRGLSYGLLRYVSDAAKAHSLADAARPQVLFNYLGQLDQMTAGSRLFRFATESAGPWHALDNRRTHPIEILALVRNGKLRIDWLTCAHQVPAAEARRMADNFTAALRAIITHCTLPCAGGRTPTDFPLASLSQREIDDLWQRHPGFADAYPLTPMQRLFYVMEQAGSGVGLEQWQFRIDGTLEPRWLRQAFEQAVARHPMLRTAFVMPGPGEPVQIVLPGASLPWLEQDWRGLDDDERELALRRELEQDRNSGLDVTRPPLMRVLLLRMSETEWRLIWTTHHLCIDGWSWPRLFREVSISYDALAEGRPPALEPAVGYASYVAWLLRHAPASNEYWRQQLAGVSAPTPLPLSLNGPATGRRPAQAEPVEWETSLTRAATESVVELARANQITLGTVIQAGWALLLAHYSDSTDVLFGASFAGRPAEVDGVETIIGPCVTNVPVRETLQPDEPVHNWLARFQRHQIDLNQHQYTPLDAIQDQSAIPWRSRLFDSVVVFQNYQVDAAAGQLGRDARITPITTPETTNYALTVIVTPAERLTIKLIYLPRQLTHHSAEAMLADLTTVLETIGRCDPRACIRDVLAALPGVSRGRAVITAKSAVSAALTTPIVAPRGDAERRLLMIWRQLLGDRPISIDDNFFDAGGQSILLVRAHRLIEEEFAISLPIVVLLQFPTIRTLAGQLGTAPSGTASGRSDDSPTADSVTERARKQREAIARQRRKERSS